MNFPQKGVLCCITPEEGDPVLFSEQVLKGGADMIQLRRKRAPGRDLCRWSEDIQQLCRRHNALFIVNDRLDIALSVGADGVHLGQEDIPAAEARALLENGKLLGVSVSSAEEALRAENDGADYVGFGHIFPTSSKQKPGRPTGTERLGETARSTGLPVLAIGGITGDTLGEVIEAGAWGIAIISAVSTAPDPTLATRNLKQRIQAVLR